MMEKLLIFSNEQEEGSPENNEPKSEQTRKGFFDRLSGCREERNADRRRHADRQRAESRKASRTAARRRGDAARRPRAIRPGEMHALVHPVSAGGAREEVGADGGWRLCRRTRGTRAATTRRCGSAGD